MHEIKGNTQSFYNIIYKGESKLPMKMGPWMEFIVEGRTVPRRLTLACSVPSC